MQIQRITTAAIAAAGLSFAGLGAFAAMPASAATTAIGHPIKHPIKALAKCHVKGQLGWTVAGKRYLCEKPAGWHFYRWVAHPMAKPKPPVPAPTPKQQLQAWADASGNADWYQVVKTDTNRLVNDESTSPVTCNLLDSCSTVTYDVPSGGLQTLIAADALTLVTDARSAVADAPPGNLTASWDAFMNGQVVYGQHINADPANWFTYTFSPAAGNAVVAAAVTDGLVGIYLLGPPNAPTPGIPTP